MRGGEDVAWGGAWMALWVLRVTCLCVHHLNLRALAGLERDVAELHHV